MTGVKGRLTNWIEAKVRALSATVPMLPTTEKAPPHIRVTERGARAQDRHAGLHRSADGRGHRARR